MTDNDIFSDMYDDDEEEGTTPEPEVNTGSSPFSNADFGISTKPTAPEANKPAPEANKPAPESNKPAPEVNKPAPEANKPAPESNKPVPEASKPAPESNKPASGEVDINNLPLAVAFVKLKKGIAPDWGTANAFDTLLAACIVVDSKKYAVLSAYDVVCVRKPDNFDTFDEFVKSTSSKVFSSFKVLASVGSTPNADDTAANAWLVEYAKSLLGENAPESNDFKDLYDALVRQLPDEFERLWRSDSVQSSVKTALDTTYNILRQVYSSALQRLGGTQGVLAVKRDSTDTERVNLGIKWGTSFRGLMQVLDTPFTPVVIDLFSLKKEVGKWSTSSVPFEGGENSYEVWFHAACISGSIPAEYNSVVYKKEFSEIEPSDPVGASDADIKVFEARLYNLLKSLFYTYFRTTNSLDKGIETLKRMASGEGVQPLFSEAVNKFQDRLLRFYILHEVPKTNGVFEFQFCLPTRTESSASADANAQIIETLTDKIKKANQDTASLGDYKDLNILYSGESKGITWSEGSAIRVYSIIAVADTEYYNLAPNFSYKPIKAYIAQGKEFSYKKVLIGKSLANTDIELDLSQYRTISLYAASRSGKGVMTLSILAALLASKGACFTYGDYKPEMSTVFWNLTKSYQNAFPELNPKLLSCEFCLDPVTGQGKTNMKFYRAAGISEVPYGKSWTSAEKNPSIRKFQEFFAIPDDNLEDFFEANFFGVLAYMKYIQLCYYCATSGEWEKDLKTGKELEKEDIPELYCVLDEFTNTLKDNSKLYKKVKNNRVLGNLIKSFVIDDKKDDEVTKSLKSRRAKQLGIYFVTGIRDTYFDTSLPTLADKIEARSHTQAARSHIHFFVIGQEYQEDMSSPEGFSKADKESAADFFSFFTRYFLKSESCLRIQGNYRSANDVNDMLGEPKFSSKIEVQRCSTLGLVHQNGDIAPSGYWYLKEGSSTGQLDAVCKSYMILNRNDYNAANPYADGYVGGTLSRLAEANGDLAKKVLQQDILDESGNPVPEVGFEALATYIGTKGNANNQEQLKAFVENYGTGYKKLWDIFSQTPVCKACGYTSLEDFIYDFDPEHFVADLFAGKPISGDSGSAGFTLGFSTESDSPEFNNFAQMGNNSTSQFNNSAQTGNTPAPQSDNSEQVNNQAAQQAGNPAQAGNTPAPQFNNPAQMGTPAPQFNNPAQANSRKPPYSPDVPDTRTMSAYGAAYTDELPIKPSDNPFVIYHNNGTVSNSLLRDTITSVLFKQIASIFGGLDAITEFTIQNNVIILNKTPFTPKLPEDILNSAPFVLRNQLAQGEYAQVLHFGYLKRLKNLLAINIDNQSLADGFFWQDTIISPYKTKKLCKTWRRLQSFTVAGTDYIAKLSDEELQYSKAEQEAILEKKQARLDGFSRLKESGKNVAGAFATALGLEPSSADKHPVLNRIGKSRPAKALRRGIGFTAAAYGASLLIGLANPFLILGGLFAVGSYISSRKTDKSK